MEIKEQEIASKKKIGKLGNSAIYHIALKGGLHLILGAKGGKVETFGAASHPAIARHLARKREEGIEYTDLNKSSDYNIDPSVFEHLLPQYEELTDYLNERLAKLIK